MKIDKKYKQLIKEVVLSEINVVPFNIDPNFKKFIGKRITFKDDKGVDHYGVADFIGINRFGDFQVTASRQPIWPVDPKSIKLFK
jgi:hypothetical protein